jgi:hypothetical protein
MAAATSAATWPPSSSAARSPVMTFAVAAIDSMNSLAQSGLSDPGLPHHREPGRRTRAGCQLPELGDQLARSPRRELSLQAIFDRHQPKLAQCGDRTLRERLVGEVGQRRSVPESKRLGEHGRPDLGRRATRLVQQPLETIRIHLIRLDGQPIAAPDRLQQRRGLALIPVRSSSLRSLET